MHINSGCMNRNPISRERQESINSQPLLCKVGNTETAFIEEEKKLQKYKKTLLTCLISHAIQFLLYFNSYTDNVQTRLQAVSGFISEG